MSVDGERFEFAHFTVEEFLTSIDHTSDGEFATYSIGPWCDINEFAKVCFTYLNFQDFDQGGNADREVTERRFEEYPFREFVVPELDNFASFCDWDDMELLALAKIIFHPSKPNTLISWAQDLFHQCEDEDAYLAFQCGIVEATALHLAAMNGLLEVCRWLVENRCDMNRRTALGTPLHCALLGV